MTPEFCQHLCSILSDRLDEFLEYLEVDLKREGRYFVGRCPVHDGDNRRACVIYPNGTGLDCSWKCLTKHCSDPNKYGSSIFGFVAGVYAQTKSLKISRYESIKVVQQFLNVDIDDFSLVNNKYTALQYLQCNNNGMEPQKYLNLTRDELRSKLTIPSPNFLKRGFAADVLDKYDIGDSKDDGKKLSNRTILPIYNDDYTLVLGCQARTIFDNYEELGINKWQSLKSFSCKLYLFNYWFALPYIAEKNALILVESVANALKLIENGIYNVLACFGASLTDHQQFLIEKLLFRQLIIIFDADQNRAGLEGAKSVTRKLNKLIPVITTIDLAEFGVNDIAEMNTNQVFQLKGKYNL